MTNANGKMSGKKAIPIILAVSLILPLLVGMSEYYCLILCFINIYIISASGLDVLFGYSGQISMGHAAFYAIGGYGAGILHNYLHIPQLLAMLIAAVIACIVGAILALPASKLKFHFLSLATIAFGEIVYQICSRSPGNITNNYNGFHSDKMAIGPLQIDTNLKFYYFSLVCVVILLVFKFFITHSRTGRAFVAIRENTHAAEGMGVNVRKYKVMAFAISAFYVAIGGALYLNLGGYLHPDMFLQKQSVLFVTMMLFGGSGSMVGPVIGAISVEVILEALRMLEEYQMLIYGVMLLAVILAMPGGLVGAFKDLRMRMAGRKAQKQLGKEGQ